MPKFKVLVQAPYIIGTYIEVEAADAQAAQAAVAGNKDELEAKFAEIEGEIDSVAESEAFILNSPADADPTLADETVWSRPLVIGMNQATSEGA